MNLDEVADRRQGLNQEAYFSVLKAFLASNQNPIGFSYKLRRLLNISEDVHHQYLEELKPHMKGGGSAAGVSSAKGSAGAKGSRTAMGAKSQGQQLHSQAALQQRTAGKNKRKAEESEEARMVGYKVEYRMDANNATQIGVITCFCDGYICITFNLGLATELHKWVKWERSDNWEITNEFVDLYKSPPRVPPLDSFGLRE